MRHFSICFFTVVGLQFWTLSFKFPSHPSRYFFSENLHIKLVFFRLYLQHAACARSWLFIVPGFSPVGFFSGHRPLGQGGRCKFCVLAAATPGCGLSVKNRPPRSDTCSHLFVFFLAWRVKTRSFILGILSPPVFSLGGCCVMMFSCPLFCQHVLLPLIWLTHC